MGHPVYLSSIHFREVEAGEEVFNCYGPHFGRHPVAERRKILESQYRFTCHCHYCEIKVGDTLVGDMRTFHQ